jgi:hypothetical protein
MEHVKSRPVRCVLRKRSEVHLAELREVLQQVIRPDPVALVRGIRNPMNEEEYPPTGAVGGQSGF